MCISGWEDEHCKDAKFFPINLQTECNFYQNPKGRFLELHKNDSTIHLENKQAGRAKNNVKTRNTRFQNISEELGSGECVPGVRMWEERGSQPGKIPWYVKELNTECDNRGILYEQKISIITNDKGETGKQIRSTSVQIMTPC